MACFLEVDPHSFVDMMHELRNPGRSLMGAIMDGVFSVVDLLPAAVKPALTELSRPKQALVGGAVCLVAWRTYDSGLVGRYLVPTSVAGACRWMKHKLGYYEICYGTPVASIRTVLESRRDGSAETTMTVPRCQCLIAQEAGGKMVVVGCASRFENNVLVAPDHVLGGDDDIVKYAKGSQGWVSLKNKERIPLDTDLVAIVLADKEFAQIGMSIARVGSLQDVGVLAQVVGPESKGTIGKLNHDALCFGRVVYSGTTVAGYSGAVYMAGSVALGIHQMGGNVNGGYSADYVCNLIRLHFKQRLEASSDWILDQFARTKQVTWKYTGDPDTVQIKVNGKYSLVEAEDMRKAFGSSWSQYHTIDQQNLDHYRDYESVPLQNALSSGEEQRSQNLGASSVSENSQGLGRPTARDVIQQYAKLSRNSRKTFHTLLSQSKSQNSVLNGPENPEPSQSALA